LTLIAVAANLPVCIFRKEDPSWVALALDARSDIYAIAKDVVAIDE
jgi:hypothetical protein